MVLMSGSGREAQRSEVTCQEKLEGSLGTPAGEQGSCCECYSHMSAAPSCSTLPILVAPSRTFPLYGVGMPIPPF